MKLTMNIVEQLDVNAQYFYHGYLDIRVRTK